MSEMFGHDHYVPILKGKNGEFGALQTLTPSVRTALTPLVEVPPVDWDYIQVRPKKTIDQHLKNMGQKIEHAWGRKSRLFVDLPAWIPETERMSDGEHPLHFVFRSLRARHVDALPVVGLLRHNEYMQACRDILRQDNRGVCVRMRREDFEDFDDVGGTVGAVLGKVEAEIQNADLVFDLGSLTPDERNPDARAVIRLINQLPKLSQWQTFTLTATSFPQSLIGLPPSDSSWIPRQEWTLWRNIVCSGDQLARNPTFGDYAISHTEPPEVDPRIMRPSASIRYTCETAWLVLKGRNLRDYGFAQFHEVCRDLVQRTEYSGRQFSWGDEYIDDCAAERVGTGNLTTWRKVGTSHHLAFVADQIATLIGS
jgi:hypothetical protein